MVYAKVLFPQQLLGKTLGKVWINCGPWYFTFQNNFYRRNYPEKLRNTIIFLKDKVRTGGLLFPASPSLALFGHHKGHSTGSRVMHKKQQTKLHHRRLSGFFSPCLQRQQLYPLARSVVWRNLENSSYQKPTRIISPAGDRLVGTNWNHCTSAILVSFKLF